MDGHNSMRQPTTTESGRVRSLVVLITAAAVILLVAGLLLFRKLRSPGRDPQEEPPRYVAVPDLPNTYVFDKRDDRYWMHPLNDAEWRTPNQATHVNPGDFVVGLLLNNKAWAVPMWIMSHHHVANLVLDDRPVLVIICEVCSSGVAYDPVIGGKRHTFHVVGLYKGSQLVSDYETDTLWAPLNGEALQGPLKGSRIEPVSLYQSTWAQWLELHPASLVAYREDEKRGGHGEHYVPGKRPRIPKAFADTLLRPPDPRWPPMEMVLAANVKEFARAYPLSMLDKTGPVVNDTLGKEEIVVLHKPGTLLAIAFSRRIGDEVLVFEEGKEGGIVDRKYRGHWSYTGEAIDGALAGAKLSFIPSRVEAWYIWAAYHPETDIFGAGPP